MNANLMIGLVLWGLVIIIVWGSAVLYLGVTFGRLLGRHRRRYTRPVLPLVDQPATRSRCQGGRPHQVQINSDGLVECTVCETPVGVMQT